jgi:hypothetical protein
MQRALVSLQRQRIVAALMDNLPSDRALAVECIGGHDRTFQRQHLQQLRYCGDLVRFGIRGDLRQHQALLAAPCADHVQGRLSAGAIERTAQHLSPGLRRGRLSIAITPWDWPENFVMNR